MSRRLPTAALLALYMIAGGAAASEEPPISSALQEAVTICTIDDAIVEYRTSRAEVASRLADALGRASETFYFVFPNCPGTDESRWNRPRERWRGRQRQFNWANLEFVKAQREILLSSIAGAVYDAKLGRLLKILLISDDPTERREAIEECARGNQPAEISGISSIVELVGLCVGEGVDAMRSEARVVAWALEMATKASDAHRATYPSDCLEEYASLRQWFDAKEEVEQIAREYRRLAMHRAAIIARLAERRALLGKLFVDMITEDDFHARVKLLPGCSGR